MKYLIYQKGTMKLYNINLLINKLKSKKHLTKIIIVAMILFFGINPMITYAQSSTISFPVIDQLMCGFISYSKSKLAPYIAVLCITISVIGHWLGMSRLWGALLYVAMGLGLIMGIGSVITNATGSSASCIAN